MKNKQENIEKTLLLRIIENRADENEKSRFSKWYNSSAENAALFTQMQKAYELSSLNRHSSRENWQQVVHKIRTGYKVPDYIELSGTPVSGRKINLNILLRVAAIIVLAIGMTFLFKTVVFKQEQLVIYGNNLKNNKPYQLSDGSLVYLHGNAAIEFPKKFGSKNREISLKGEAFFEVKRNQNMPFVISTNKTKTRVLGTSFNVFSEGSGKVKVSVVTGIVEFSIGKNQKVELRPGDEGSFNPVTNEIEKSTISDPNFQSWKTGIFVFRDTPLEKVFNLLGNYYAHPLVFDGEKGTMPTVTNTFDHQSLEAVLEELNLLLNTQNVVNNDTIVFKPNR